MPIQPDETLYRGTDVGATESISCKITPEQRAWLVEQRTQQHKSMGELIRNGIDLLREKT